MAYVTQRVSDFSGKQAADTEFVAIIVRKHPKLDVPVQLDALPDEISGLKENTQYVVLELKMPGGEARTVTVTLNDFNKLDPEGKMDEKLEAARPTRGRIPGTRITPRNGS